MPSIPCCPGRNVPTRILGSFLPPVESCPKADIPLIFDEDTGGWSGSSGGLTIWVGCQGTSAEDIRLTFTFSQNGCESHDLFPEGPSSCSPLYAAARGADLDPYLCCGLPADIPLPPNLVVQAMEAPVPAVAVPPRVAPRCSAVPPGQRDCCLSSGGSCGGCDSCEGGSCGPPTMSVHPVRYATGELLIAATDIQSGGLGGGWGHTRSFSNRPSHADTLGNGFNWHVQQWPFLVFHDDETVVAQGEPLSALWFTRTAQGFVADFGAKQTLHHDATAGHYVLTDIDGATTEFDDFTGVFRRHVSPGGATTEVTAVAANGFNPAQVERTFSVGGATTTEQFSYEYDSATGDELLQRLTLRRRQGSGSWKDVSRAIYVYYGGSELHGREGDLKTVTTQRWDGSQWQNTGTTYYRYWTDSAGSGDSSSSSSSAGEMTASHLLKYVINPASFLRLADDPTVSDPLTAADSIVAEYADNYFEYDPQRRVTKESVQGGSQTFTFAYTQSGFTDGYNTWKTKTTETLPDGSQNIVYANYAGQTMLQVFKDGTDEWCEFYKYAESGALVLKASPSAVSGYSEQSADLLNEVNSNYQYLRDSEGLIHTYSHHAESGFLAGESIQHGELGSEIKLREYEYIACCPAGDGPSSSSSSSSGPDAETSLTYFRSQETVYPSDTDQTKKLITTYNYTFHDGTCAVKEKTTTLPAVPAGQNGSGVSAVRREVFDVYGHLVWSMDERGYLTKTEYDIATGAVTRQIRDVDTSQTTDEPAGWQTPTGGGLHLITDFGHDEHGRLTQTLGPQHTADVQGTPKTIRRATWMVYIDHPDHKEVRTAQGYYDVAADSDTLINPVSITKTDLAGKVTEQIQAVRLSSGSFSSSSSSSSSGAESLPLTSPGRLTAADVFERESYVRWTTTQYTGCCRESSRRVYHDIPTFGEGLPWTNYAQTSFKYDDRRRRIATVSPGGTISRQVLDARGLVIGSWIGTNDGGATASDPTGGGHPGNDMVLVTEFEHDGGTAGGDGLQTKMTQHVDGSTTRATSYLYDWRGRRTATDGEEDFYAQEHYDNLDRPIQRERYDTTASGHLIARSETKFDDRGRVYQTIQHAVDPTTGTVGGSLTDNVWYDAAGHVTQRSPADLMTQIEHEHDSLGRLTRTTDPRNAETIFTYDDAGNRTSLTDAEGNMTSWTFDAIGRVVKETNELADSRYFEYDAAGNLARKTDRNGRVTEYNQDDAGRTTEERWKDGSSTVNTVATTFDADGRVSAIEDDVSQYAYAYDLRGRMTASDNNGTPNMPRVELVAAYNRLGERLSLSATVASTDDFDNSYTYDALGRMSRIEQDGVTGGNTVAAKRMDLAYEVRGGYLTIERYEDLAATDLAAESSYVYDNYGRLTSLEHKKGTTTLASHDYSFLNRLIDSYTSTDGVSDYTHDDAAQLTAADHDFQTDENYSYDLTGNRTNTGYVTGDNNQLLSDGTYDYQYDAEGNRTRRTHKTTGDYAEYEWDHRNRLTAVTFKTSGGTVTKAVEYVYDVHNQRIIKKLDSTGNGTFDSEWRFVFDRTVKGSLSDLVLAYDGSNALRHRYLHGPGVDQILADEDPDGEIFWPLADHLGTVRDLADYDAATDTATIANHLTYDSFGQITSQTNAGKTPHFAFTGREWDPDAGLYWYRARWYDERVGRFVSEDPITFTPNEFNLYRYAANHPCLHGDPSGLINPVVNCLIGAGIGGLLAGAFSYFSSLLHDETACQTNCKAGVNAAFGAIGGCLGAGVMNPCLASTFANLGAVIGSAICDWYCDCGGIDSGLTCGLGVSIATSIVTCLGLSGLDASTPSAWPTEIREVWEHLIGAVSTAVGSAVGVDISFAC